MLSGKCGMIKKNKTILLTGVTGFIGSFVLKALLKKYWNIIVLKRRTSDLKRIKDVLSHVKIYDLETVDLSVLFERENISGIVHLATDYGKKHNNDISLMVQANIELPLQLLKAGISRGLKFFVNTHTYAGAEYNLYSSMKAGFLDMAQYYAANSDCKIVHMRLEYVYGPGDDTDKLIPMIIENLTASRSTTATPGGQKRDFIYIDDVTEAYLRLLDRIDGITSRPQEFQIGTGKSVALKIFVDKIAQSLGKKGLVEWGKVPYRHREIFDSKANTKEAKKLLDWSARFSIDQGIAKTLSYYGGNSHGK